jgi:hypothetical protein
MKRVPMIVAALLLAPLVLASVTSTSPIQAPWVDPNLIQGKLLASIEMYAGTGMVAGGTVSDPENHPLTAAFVAPSGAVCSMDPNTNTWSVEWWPTAGQVGIHYLVMVLSEELLNQPKVLTDTGTLAVWVKAENLPPEIKYGGCQILRK